MLPVFCTHSSYQSFVLHQLKDYYSGGLLTFVSKDWHLLEKFWLTDLSQTDVVLTPYYSTRGPSPRNPSAMLRSYLLMLQVGIISITDWVDALIRCPIYAIISGFTVGDTPGVGTFYDFFNRLWLSENDNFTCSLKSKRTKIKKGKKGEKAATTSPSKVKKLIERFQKYPLSKNQLPFDLLFDLFMDQFVMFSANLGLLGNPNSLSVSGDGTPIYTAAHPRSKRTCDCFKQGIEKCSCKRNFSQPDCDTGWDSYRDRFFNGYHLYMFAAAESFHDLPLYPRLQRASRHDSISLIISTEEFRQRYKHMAWDKIILDAAHDALPIYEYFIKLKVKPFIDLNTRNTGNTVYKDTFTLSPEGIPICRKGLEMKDNGCDRTRGRRKYRCPLIKNKVVTCDNPCSDSSYGRCIYTYLKDNPRLFPPVARKSKEWENTYKRRTGVERSNKREKVDYMLEAAKHQSTKMWTVRTYGIMMCQHIDAWFAEIDIDLKSSLLLA